MQSPTEEIWERMKAKAQEYARNGTRPKMKDARKLVSSLFGYAGLMQPPPQEQEVVDMYTGEFLAMIDTAISDLNPP
jgi:hypothetical protein